MARNRQDGDGPGAPDTGGMTATTGRGGPVRRRRPRGSWRALFFAPVGDGQTRRRGSDGVRIALALLALVLCWVATRANSGSEHGVASVLSSPPQGIRWLVTAVWWIGSIGVIALVAGLALASRRWSVVRDVAVSGAVAWLLCILSGHLLGLAAGRPPTGLPVSNVFPVARVAATVAVAIAAMPYLSRWVQLVVEWGIGLLALATVVHGSGLPVAVLASLALGWGVAAAVHLVFGSPLGLPSADEVAVLLGDLELAADGVARRPVQEWGVGRFTATVGGAHVDVSVYGRDASDAQLLAKTVRYLFYRDSGPTLALTRRQQVEHEAYLTLMADRAGAHVPAVLAAGPAGPARDELFVTRPPAGVPLTAFAPNALPADTGAVSEAEDGVGGGKGARVPPADPDPRPVIGDDALDAVLTQLLRLRRAGIAHGALSVDTILVTPDGAAGFVDLRAASTVATPVQLDCDLAATLAALALVAGPERTLAAAARIVPTDAVVAALPFLQRAALGPTASRSLRGHKAVLTALREHGAEAAGVEVPKLLEPRRISWISLALVAGTLIGGWALIGVLVNVSKSWSTITGASWGWVAVTFVLAQAAYPSSAMATVGSVTNPLPYGRTLALEVSNTFVALAGGSMAVLATRVRFFQQEGYDATLAVSSGVLVSTASWIVKGALFLVALPIAIGKLHFSTSPTANVGSHSGPVWFIVLAIVVVGLVVGLLLFVPRWRRLATEKLRPKVSEVWSHLRVLAEHPRNLVEIFGGNTAAQLVIALSLGAALHAFGDSLGLAELLVVLTLASMLGGISPVPGGMGVVEAGMILGLTAAGINESDAVAAVFVQRLFTAYLPPIWGWFVLVWMRRKEYL